MRERRTLGIKERELEAEKEYVEDLERAREELREYSYELQVIDNAIPEKREIPSFIYHTENMARDNRILFREFGSFDDSPSQEFPGLEEIEIDFSFFGSYSAFREFIFHLEDSARIMDIASIDIEGGEDVGDHFDFHLTLRIYSYLDPEI